MAIMLISDYAGFIGLSVRRVRQLVAAGQIEGTTQLKERITIIDTDKAKIVDAPGKTRREDGNVIGRSKKLKNVVVKDGEK